ncbi:TMEM165/GDT1 family protein [Marmoricola endophyticus]|nr:TMEM165/GDT1 family protein [Marmoricola endophyticus]
MQRARPSGRADETFDQITHPWASWSKGVRTSAALLGRSARLGASMYAFLLSTAVIFVAELGDKSQLMAMTFASRYRARDVLLGITVATAVVHLASVGIGALIGNGFSEYQGVISIVAGVAFLGFAAWTLRGDELTEEEASKARSATGAAILAVGVAFFLAELGDKTMLATITLATQEGWLGTWIGSTVGMVAADALAIVVGAVLAKRLPEKAIKYGAAALFALFGVVLVLEGAGVLG